MPNPIEIRSLKDGDLLKVDKIWQESHSRDFGLPTLEDTITTGVATVSGDIIAFGTVKLYAELIFVPDKTRSKREIAATLLEMLPRAIAVAKKTGLSQLNCFIYDSDYGKLLQKHFGFKLIPGTALVLDLEK